MLGTILVCAVAMAFAFLGSVALAPRDDGLGADTLCPGCDEGHTSA